MKRFAVFLFVATLLVAQTPTYQGAGIKTPVAINKGGTGTGSTLVGLVRGNASAMTAAELSGDAATSGSNAVVLATVNAGPGTCGDSTHVCQVTTNAKGLTTSQSAVAISGAAAGALVQLETHILSSSATADFTTCISGSTYHTFEFRFNQVSPATNSTFLEMLFSTNGGSTYDTGTNYTYTTFLFNSGGVSQGGAANAAAFNIIQNQESSGTTTGGAQGYLDISNPLDGTHDTNYLGLMRYYNGTNLTGNQILGTYQLTTAVNAVRFLYSSGNIASGTITCYGITP